MYLSEEDALYILGMGAWFISLAICLILICFQAFRRRDNVFASAVQANLLAGFVYVSSFPAAAVQETWFEQAGPNYPVAPAVAEIKSIYFPDLRAFEKAAYSCYGVNGESLCDLRIGQLISTGRLDFIETGQDPVIRYEMRYLDAGCLQYDTTPDFVKIKRGPYPVEPALGVCVSGHEVETVRATHEFRAEDRQQIYPSRRNYIHAELIDRSDNSVLAQLDGWYGASPYFLNEKVEGRRRPDGLLGELIRLKTERDHGYDREKVDNLMAQHGFDEGILMMAANSPYQSYQASALWLGCRTQLSDSISPQNKQRLREISATLFSDAPDWRYPDSCPNWAS